ncbi:MAG: hypothetical protein JW801_08155 [Bacteroidales bacterium]|nr:hypothetical protein [Bacteroidales bacterium]
MNSFTRLTAKFGRRFSDIKTEFPVQSLYVLINIGILILVLLIQRQWRPASPNFIFNILPNFLGAAGITLVFGIFETNLMKVFLISLLFNYGYELKNYFLFHQSIDPWDMIMIFPGILLALALHYHFLTKALAKQKGQPAD